MAGKRPSLKKRFFQSRVGLFMVSLFITLALRLLWSTCRITYNFPPALDAYVKGKKSAIFCFWHGRMAMQLFIKPPRPMLVLSSRHRDGALTTAIMRRFDIHAVRGSKKSGSAAALRELFAIAARGDNISFTPDGPRGPFQVAANGAAFVAIKTGYPLIPVAFSATRYWRFKSWDKFMLPKFFSHIIFVAADPIPVTATSGQEDDAVQHYTATLTEHLNHITALADAQCGAAA